MGRAFIELINHIKFNNYPLKNFLILALSFQIAIYSVIGLDIIGLRIPFIRELVGLIYLTFLPGIIILRILRLHRLTITEVLLYSVSLSIAILMLIGLFMNLIYPFFEISRPISTIPVLVNISILQLILLFICYMNNKDYYSIYNKSYNSSSKSLSSPALLLCLLPILTIIGTYLVNYHQINTLLMVVIILIALILALICFNKFIHEDLYSLAIFTISISLLYHASLISTFIWGSDLHREYYFSSMIMNNSYWDFNIPGNINGMLSIVMVAPIISSICSISLTYVFKAIYPLLFSLVPLGLYQIYRRQTNSKIAFLSCFFLISLNSFYWDMPNLGRQEIAELFLVSLILLQMSKSIDKVNKSILSIVFSLSLIVSHYGLTYLALYMFVFTLLLLTALNHFKGDITPIYQMANRNFVLFMLTSMLAWYMFISGSSNLTSIVHISDHIIGSITDDFLKPDYTAGSKLTEVINPHSIIHMVYNIMTNFNQFLIILGLVTVFYLSKYKFTIEYLVISLSNLILLIIAISVPFFASALNITRLYHIAILFLAPFCIIGGIEVLNEINIKILRKNQSNTTTKLSVYLMVFFLFNTGFIWDVINEDPISYSLSQEKILRYDLKNESIFMCGLNVFEQDVHASQWISKQTSEKSKIYTDYTAKYSLISYGMVNETRIMKLENTTKIIEKGSYIRLGYLNNIKKVSALFPKGARPGVIPYNTKEIYGLLHGENEIYSNYGSDVYYTR